MINLTTRRHLLVMALLAVGGPALTTVADIPPTGAEISLPFRRPPRKLCRP
ncbi:MAG: hypothetical protein J6386_01800 [Candidatus Synoicihabitans palmerolidicus]|nr:hypothetical protein [Candidatus Synoicihabitans palmerolidicus]